jgi:hypothetical protein
VNSNDWHDNPDPTAALVALAIADLQSMAEAGDLDILLLDFIFAAWPSPRAQRQ